MSTGTVQFPRQDIPETQKNESFFKKHLDFAEHLITNGNYQNQKMDRLYNGYNGKTEADSIKYLVSTYGKKNRAKYIPYRLSKAKIDGLQGEFLKMPLNSTVHSVNNDAVTEKMQKYELMLGAMNAKKEIEKLRSVGVNVLEGMEIPDKNDPAAFSKMSFKEKNEVIMQVLLQELIKDLNIKLKLSNNLQDCIISSRTYGRIIVNELNGDMTYEPIDPRDRIVMEFDKDPFLEKTPIKGSRQRMPVDKILTTFNLTDTQRDQLEDIRNNSNEYVNNSSYRNRYSMRNGEFCCDVIHIEWRSVRPKYEKLTKQTNAQAFFTGTDDKYRTTMSPQEYEPNREKYDKKVSKGEMEIVTTWEEDMYESVRIGHEIDVNMRRKPFITRDEDTGRILGFSYEGMVFNEVDGETISLKEITENLDNAFDIVMFQLLKEINKAKGKLIVYDRAGLPKKTSIKQVLYNALNDSFIDWDSSAAGNTSGKDLNINSIFKEIDLGVSSSFQHLLIMKRDIVESVDKLTGINNARQGNIQASATVSNTQTNLEASTNITEPLFYYMSKFSERVLNALAETGKLVWGIYQPNRARMVLGDEKYSFLKLTSDIAFASYRTSLVNPRWEQQLKDRMRGYAEFSLNAKELRPIDMLNFELAETISDAKGILKKSWEEIQKVAKESQERQLQAQAEQSQAGQEHQEALMKEDREDRQAHDLDKIRLEGQIKQGLKTQEGKNKALVDANKFEQEGLSNFENL